MKMVQLVNEYMAALTDNLASSGTIANKRSILGRFAQDCPELPLQPDLITHFLKTLGNSEATRKSARKHIRAFYTFACQKYDLPDPMPQVPTSIRGIKRPRRAPQHIVGGGAARPQYPPGPSIAPAAELLSTSEAITAYLTSKKGRWTAASFDWNKYTLLPFANQFKYMPTDPDAIEEFITFPDTHNKRHVRYRTLTALYNWLERRYDLTNPMRRLDPISQDHKPVIPLDDAEIEKLLSVELSPQEKGILHALLTTGMRPGELRNLKPESIMDQTIVLNGKTGVDSTPIKPEIRDLLLKISGQNYVFEDGEGMPYSKDALYRIIENIMLRAGVRDGQGGARLFRHTFITRVYEASGDPFLVQRLARHTSQAMTKHYEHSGLSSTIKKYQDLDFLPTPANGNGAGVGLEEGRQFEDQPFPVEGAVQLGMEIAGAGEKPTPPFTIKEYAYKYQENDGLWYKRQCWRIIGANGAWWPITGDPRNFLSLEEAQIMMRALWGKGGKSEKE